MSPEKIASYEHTAVKRGKNQGTSGINALKLILHLVLIVIEIAISQSLRESLTNGHTRNGFIK
jgi:hypothetical protein